MVRRGLVPSREEAATAIRAGTVLVAGRPATKAAALVAPAESISIAASSGGYVSRGGRKLEAALERFPIDVRGRLALDAGASTGGFTHCLLLHGAAAVVAVDVGYGQLDWSLRTDERVTVLERTNVRGLDPEMLPFVPDLVTADLSFISLTAVLPALVRCAADRADFVLLVKPQFEAPRTEVAAGGIVSDPGARRAAIVRVAGACAAAGLVVRDVMVSPVLGPAGNAEFFLWAPRDRRSGDAHAGDATTDTDSPLDRRVDEAVLAAPDASASATS
jgi:23S rRNA (cytidine1920-2'-O)/16S rRNA (cytidine1409-2'-O)-methyltransferase